jgi:protein O-mannosyl-transferase
VKKKVQPTSKPGDGYRSLVNPLLLCILVLVLYAPSLKFQLTELDDSIFIRENASYNNDLSNLITSFHRGVFAEKKDTYYRPLLLDSFVLNYKLSPNPRSFHAINILFHLLAVWLLYRLLLKLKIPSGTAGWLSALFAVHPALVQAVSWIPGRNDTLLAICAFSAMLATLKYLESGRSIPLFFSFFWMLAALFTKESAVFLPVGIFLILWLKAGMHWRDRKAFLLAAAWIVALVIWAAARRQAALEGESPAPAAVVAGFFERLPVLLQYFGKTLLPFNLSVFPMLRDSNWVFPMLAVVFFAVLLYFSRPLNIKVILAGGGWFLLMLLPVVLLPAAINAQDFEHRLYVPFPGMLLILAETFIFTRTRPVIRTVVLAGMLLLYSGLNLAQQKKFSDPVTFWEQAVKDAPHSAYATMMLGARLNDTQPERGNALILKALELNPEERYVNFYVGRMYNEKQLSDSAEGHLLKELQISEYYETWFQLALVEFNRKNLEKSIQYMATYLGKNPYDQVATQNYILMLLDTGHNKEALDFVQQKAASGMALPPELVTRVHALNQQKP